MEPTDFRLLVDGVMVAGPTHDRSQVTRLARAFIREGAKQVVLEGRAVTPWRDMEIPYPPDKETS
jgi:hypothetical protein